MNKVILMGRLTKDPDVRSTTDGKTIARYTLAVDRRFGKDNTADFISCVVFGKGAEFAEKYLQQGTKIVATGRIQTGSYTNNEGKKVYTTDVVIEDMQMCGSKAEKVQQEQKPSPAPTGQADYQQQSFLPETPKEVSDGFLQIPEGLDEELPFI